MKTSIQMLSLGSTELFFLFDHHHNPTIEVKDIQYTSLEVLVQSFPQLYHQQNLEKFALIANFLTKGIEFQYIKNIELFKENYYQQIEAEHSSLLNEGPQLKDHGIFDLSIMHLPRFEDNKLVFFVKHDDLSLPYKASLIYPIQSNQLDMSYELLPLIE